MLFQILLFSFFIILILLFLTNLSSGLFQVKCIWSRESCDSSHLHVFVSTRNDYLILFLINHFITSLFLLFGINIKRSLI